MEISLRELKQWRLWAQYLTEKTTPLQAAGDLCGIQAQYAANAIHALAIRCENTDTTGLLKSWTLRGTLHLFPEKDLPLYLPEGRCDFFDTPYGQWRYGHGCAVSRERMGFFAQVVESALSAEPVTRDRLKALCRERGMTAEEEPWVFDGWAASFGCWPKADICASAPPKTGPISAVQPSLPCPPSRPGRSCCGDISPITAR